jgi:arginine deiminase
MVIGPLGLAAFEQRLGHYLHGHRRKHGIEVVIIAGEELGRGRPCQVPGEL